MANGRLIHNRKRDVNRSEGAISGRKRTTFEREIDLVDEARLYLQGYTFARDRDWETIYH